jgi:RNA polymerase-interacting CarD/CdnL/TRCF family regulator
VTTLTQTATLPLVGRKSRSRRKFQSGPWFEVGEAVRYQGLGAGRVVDLIERDFCGERRMFAVIDFPHRALRAQVPLGEESYRNKLRPVAGERKLRALLRSLEQEGNGLLRTWDAREEVGERVVAEGQPEDWAELLRDYASASRKGMLVTASDADLVRTLLHLFAAEYACATGSDFASALEKVEASYRRSAQPHAR